MSSQKNILFLHHVSCLGGAESYLLSVIEILDQSHKKHFISQNFGPLTEILRSHDVNCHEVAMRGWRRFKYSFLNLVSVRKIMKYCRERNINFVCCNSYRVSPYAVLTARKLGIPCVSILHDFVPPDKLRKFYFLKSDAIVAVSESIAATIRPYFKKNIFSIYNGLDAKEFEERVKDPQKLRREFGVSEKTKIVGMVANIIPLKGHKLFLDAMEQIFREFDDVKCVIIGESPDESKLNIRDLKIYANQLNIADKVIFTGGRDDVPDLLSAFNILVSASDREAFGRVIIEAMALSIPVVATRCGGPEEIVVDGETGFLVPKADSAAMAACIKSLLLDKNKRGLMGMAGKERLKNIFTPEKTVQQFNRVFEQLMDTITV